MERRVYLTEEALKRCRAAAAKAGGPVVFTDDRLRGFLFKANGESGTWYVQREVGGKTIRLALGRTGGKQTANDFRDLAEKVRGELGDANKAAKAGDAAEAARIVARLRDRLERDGAPARPNARADAPQAFPVDGVTADGAAAPKPEDEWTTFTVAQAMEEHFSNMRAKNRARSVARMREDAERYLGEWLSKPIATIRRRECIDRHREVTAQHGKTVANKAFRNLRAYWYSAAARFEVDDEHVNPVRKMTWNEENKGKPIPWEGMPEWAAQVNAIRNPVRRDWYWFVLFTALRNEDARNVRWEEVNLTDKAGWYTNAQGERIALPPKSMHRPCPKGGPRKAFTVPLCAQVVEILKRRKAENPALFGDDHGWAFPARDGNGFVAAIRWPKQQDYLRDDEGSIIYFRRGAAGEWIPAPKGERGKAHGVPRKATAVVNPHTLRHTFASTADEEGVNVSERVMKGLMNHTPDSANMSHRYNKPSMDAMRAATEKVSAFLIRKAGTSPAASNPVGRIVRADDAQGESRQASA